MSRQIMHPCPTPLRFGRLGVLGILAVLIVAAGALLAPRPLSAQEPAAQPAAQPASEGPRRTMIEMLVFQERRIEEVLTSIQSQTGVPVLALGKVPGSRVSIFEKNIELEDALTRLGTPNGWVWYKNEDGSYGLADEAWYKANILPTKVVTKIFRPDHVSASELEKAIRPMLTQGISSVTADPRTNKLIVSDLPEVIAQIERLIREIDVQLFTRVFYIRHGDVNQIAQKIESYKSEPGTIEVDEKTHQIIVEDLLANIKKMELLIDILDVGPEIVIYDVNNIGLEGKDLEDLQKIIDTIRTPDLLFEVNEKQGVFILEDVPEVHDRVEQILASFDQPVKQVLIQGEILSTTFNRTFDIGLRQALYSSEPKDLGSVSMGGPGTGFAAIDFTDDFVGLQGGSLAGAVLSNQALFEWRASFSDSNTRVLLQPRLLVKNQESSRIFVGTEEPFLTTFFNDNVSGTVTRSTSQQVVTDGLTFEITPSISNSYLVEMDIRIDNDNANPVERESGGQTTTLIRRERQSVETVLTIPSSQTRVIGGLITSAADRSHAGLPFLAKIPVFGALFGQKTSRENRANLQLFITPTIVEDVIPRPTSEDGRRGKLVTGYERVPGSYDLNIEAEFQDMSEIDVDALLAPDVDDVDAAIEELLREGLRRETSEEQRDSSYVPTRTGGTATIGEQPGEPATADTPRPAPRPAPRPQPTQPTPAPSEPTQPEVQPIAPSPPPERETNF